MTRRTAETLLVLVEHAGQVLTKDEIMRAVWADRVVDEANLAQNIAVIRKTLNVGKGSPGWIETFPGRGYRLEGPVLTEEVAPALVPAAVADPHNAGPVQRQDLGQLPAGGARRRSTRLTTILLSTAVVVGFFAWWLLSRRMAPPGAAETLSVKPVTRLQGREYHPALSPDGSKLAFLWTEEGAQEPSVWIVQASHPTPSRVSTRLAHYSSPCWSPQGHQLAYLRMTQQHSEIVISEPWGDEWREKIVAVLPSPNYGFDHRLLDWSPDGKLLAVSHPESFGRPPGIWLISLVDGSRRLLTRPGSEATADVDPRFSPDGSTISFLRLLHRSLQEVFMAPVNGSERPRPLTRLGKMISSHDWLADGKTLLIASNQSGEYRLWRQPVQGGPIRPEAIYNEFPIQLSVARRASVLVYAPLHQDRNIWKLGLRDQSWRRVLATTAQDASPVFSPDGQRIVFRSDRSGEEQLWVSDASGLNLVQVTSGNLAPSVGRWAPDGKSLVFNNPRTFDIFLATEQQGGWRIRKLAAQGVHPVISSDGKWIYAGGSQLIRIPVEDGPAQLIRSLRAESLALSPDGRFLYFVREANGTEIWRLELKDGAPVERVVDRLLPSCSSCWAVGRDGLYYLAAKPETLDRQAIYFHPFSSSEKDRLVAEYPEPIWPHGSGPFSLSPSEDSLLVVRVAVSSGDIMRVEPFR